MQDSVVVDEYSACDEGADADFSDGKKGLGMVGKGTYLGGKQGLRSRGSYRIYLKD